MFVDIFRRFSFNNLLRSLCDVIHSTEKLEWIHWTRRQLHFSVNFYCAVVEWNQGQTTWNAIVSIRMNSFIELCMHLRGFIFSVLLIKSKERANAHFVTSSIIFLTSLDVVRTPPPSHTRAYAHTHFHRQQQNWSSKRRRRKFPFKLEKLFVSRVASRKQVEFCRNASSIILCIMNAKQKSEERKKMKQYFCYEIHMQDPTLISVHSVAPRSQNSVGCNSLMRMRAVMEADNCRNHKRSSK